MNQIFFQVFFGLSLLLVGCSETREDHRKTQTGAPNQGAASGGISIPPSTNQVPPPQTSGGTNAPPQTNTPPPVADTSSKGAGGALGLHEQAFTDSNGVRSSYKINAPADSGLNKAYGIHIHLHGDGGGGYTDFPNRETRGGLIGVAVKAPNQDLTWGRAEGVPHAKYLQDLIQNELLKKYNIDTTRIYFSGVSGGSYFLAGHFIPLFAAKYATGAFLMCGGMAPQVKFADASLLKSFRIHWEITAGERRDIKDSVRQSIAGYKKQLDAVAGAPADIQTNHEEGPGGHCEFDGKDYTSGIQFMMDQKFLTIVKTP